MNHKRILVTGGAGFIGSWLAERLLAAGWEVFIIDDLSTGCFDNIEHLTKNSNFHYEIGSVFNESVLSVLVDRCDYICHLVAAVGVKTVMTEPLRSLENNIRGTELVLKLADKKKRPVLIASSSEVYGKNGKVPFSEIDNRVYGSAYNYRWGYAFSKAIDEFLALAYWREKKLPTVVVRFFNTVGPRQSASYGMVLPIFVKQCLANQPITIHGSGNQTRCFGHVDDIVDGLMRMINSDQVFGEIFNLGNTEEISIKDLAIKVKTMTNSNSEIQFVAYEDVYGDGFEDMERRVPDISKAKQLLGWEPKQSLEDIIRSVILYYENRSRYPSSQ